MKRSLIVISLSILLMIGQWGCALFPSYKPPFLSDQIKAELGTIGVVSARFKPEAIVKTPLGKKDGAKAGAKEGAWEAVDSIGEDPVLLILLPITLPISAGVGALVGSMRGVSDSEKEEAEAVLYNVIHELKVQETMREHILNIAQEKTIYHFSQIEELGPTSSYEKGSYDSLRGSGINTVLEISVWEWKLSGEGTINPPLHFAMNVQIRVFRVEDDKELYDQNFQYQSKKKNKFTKWTANNGQLFKEEFNRGCQSLAEEIVRKLFLAPKS